MKLIWGIITGLIGGFIYALTSKKDTPESETMAKKSIDNFSGLNATDKARILESLIRKANK